MSNLPPGCSVRDIPGNRPEDLRAEAMFELAYGLTPAYLSDNERDALADKITEAIEGAWDDGYKQGQDYERLGFDCCATDPPTD